MRTSDRFFVLLATCFVTTIALAQTPQWEATGSGESFLSPNTANPNPVYNATIGTSFSDFATLRVRGDQLPVNSSNFGGLCTFRTDVGQATQQGWEMWRDLNHIGRIWHPGQHRSFHFQSTEPRDDFQDRYSGAMIQNNNDDGLWVIHNGLIS